MAKLRAWDALEAGGTGGAGPHFCALRSLRGVLLSNVDPSPQLLNIAGVEA